MKRHYVDKDFRPASLALISQADAIMHEYAEDGYDLTLRQLYYQCVARGVLANTEKNYKKLGGLVSDARLAGMLDWDVMVDRTRELRQVYHWTGPSDIVDTCARQFRLDTREGQGTYIEVWVEKEALAGIVVPVCEDLDVHCLVCRGYVSQSAMWQAACRFGERLDQDQDCLLLHLGDHDPSGIDMTRDIKDRLNDTFGEIVNVDRIALTMNQIKELNPPPNPAKTTDSRYQSYVDRYGDESWEMDALDPRALTRIIRENVAQHTNLPLRRRLTRQQSEHREQLKAIAMRLSDEPDWRP